MIVTAVYVTALLGSLVTVMYGRLGWLVGCLGIKVNASLVIMYIDKNRKGKLSCVLRLTRDARPVNHFTSQCMAKANVR